MTQLLEQAIERARALPPETQDAFAETMLMLLDEGHEPVVLSVEEQASFTTSLDQAARRDYASDAQVKAVWAKHGL